MLALKLRREDNIGIRITTPLGSVVVALLASSSGGARLGLTARRDIQIDRIDLDTGLQVNRSADPSPDQPSLTDGVAEATLACTGSSSEPARSNDAPDAAGPVVRLNQGAYERAITARQLAECRAIPAVIDAVD